MKLIETIKNFFYRLKLTLFSDEYEPATYNHPTPPFIEREHLEINSYPQNDPNAILKWHTPLIHYFYRDLDTISKRCDADKTLNYYNEVQNLLDRYIFKGTKQNNDERDTVGAYMKFIGRFR